MPYSVYTKCGEEPISAPVEKLGGRSPLETAEFFYPELFSRLEAFGIQKIEKDKVVLKPYLLK